MERNKNFDSFLEECNKYSDVYVSSKSTVTTASTGSNYMNSYATVNMNVLPKEVKENIFIKEENVLLEAIAPLIDDLYKKEIEAFDKMLNKERKKAIKKTCDTAIRNVYFDAKAGTTVVIWKDGSKSLVRCQNGEKFDYEKGLAMAIVKHYMGGDTPYYNEVFKKWVPKEED